MNQSASRYLKQRLGKAPPIKAKGVSLIELMIGIVLGMLAVLAVLSVYLVMARTHATGDNLARIQENTRIAFELMTSDIRDAGLILCGSDLALVNTIPQPPAAANSTGPDFWWNAQGVRGYQAGLAVPGLLTGIQAGNRAANTEAVQVSASRGNGIGISNFTPETPGTPATFTLQSAAHGFRANEAVVVCNQNQAHLARITPSPLPPAAPTRDVTTTLAASPAYQSNSTMAAYSTTLWYVGCTGRGDCAQPGGRALYRIASGESNSQPEEVIPDVSDMQVLYLVRGATQYVGAANVADNEWVNVTALRVSLTFHSTDRNVATESAQEGRLFRTVTHTIALRNRVP